MPHILKQHKLFVKFAKILLFSLIAFLVVFGTIEYQGKIYIYILFSLISNYLLLFAFRKEKFFFETFLSILLWLGFWFKFTMTIVFTDGKFREGVGTFDYAPNAFDETLIISSIGIVAFILSGYIRKYFFNYPQKINSNYFLKINFKKYSFLFILITCFLILLTSGINVFFKIYQKGLVPLQDINFLLSGLIKFMLLFGLSSLVSFLIYFHLINKKKISFYLIIIAVFETFLSSLSMISRGMIFNSFSTFYGVYNFSKKIDKKLNFKFYFYYIFLILFLFYISVITVNHLRVKYFYVGNSYLETSNQIPKDEKKLSINEDKEIKFSVAQSNNEIIYLLINRWVGIDAVMAINAKKELLNFKFLKSSLDDEFNLKGIPFYEKNFELLTPQNYKQYKNVKGNTLTGIIGFLFYSGSYTFLFISMILLCLLGGAIEYLAFRLSGYNLIFSAIIGQTIAFRFIHFGYLPSNSYLLFFSIFLIIFFIVLVRKIFKI